MQLVVPLAVAAVALAGAIGCGDGLARVEGVVLMDGQVVREADGVRCQVTFKPAGGGSPATGSVDDSGRFRLRSGSATGTPPGDYLAAVRVVEVTPPPEPGGYSQTRPLSPRDYASTARSGLRYTLEPGRNEIEIAIDSAGPQ